MSAEDRDRLFEKALTRQLRSEGAAASVAACLDADTLAAYHERLLTADEMTSAKSHIVTCSRCQQILVQLEMTQSVQESLDREHHVLVAEAASAPAPPAARQKQTSGKVARFPARKTSLLFWAAPAGAIAAAILIWVGARDYRSEHPAMNAKVQIAENRNETAAVPEASPIAPESRAKQESTVTPSEESRQEQNLRRSDALRDEVTASRSANQPRPGGNAGDRFSARGALPSYSNKVAPNALPPSEGAVAGIGGAMSAGANAGAPPPAAKSRAKKEDHDATDKIAAYDSQTDRELQKSEDKSQAVVGGRPTAPPPPPPAPASSAAKAVPVPAASQTVEVTGQAVSEGVEVASPGARAKDQKQLAARARNTYALESLQSVAAAPDGKNIWRFGPRGEIAHSADGGSTWQSQVAPLTATLTSGSAPSDKVCWIAGAAGTLLRTTDRGKHWQAVTTPIATDLGGVRASDAKLAMIWDAGNQVRYQTYDGGTTWQATANQ